MNAQMHLGFANLDSTSSELTVLLRLVLAPHLLDLCSNFNPNIVVDFA
jgi:hypothetical protein